MAHVHLELFRPEGELLTKNRNISSEVAKITSTESITSSLNMKGENISSAAFA